MDSTSIPSDRAFRLSAEQIEARDRQPTTLGIAADDPRLRRLAWQIQWWDGHLVRFGQTAVHGIGTRRAFFGGSLLYVGMGAVVAWVTATERSKEFNSNVILALGLFACFALAALVIGSRFTGSDLPARPPSSTSTRAGCAPTQAGPWTGGRPRWCCRATSRTAACTTAAPSRDWLTVCGRCAATSRAPGMG